MWFQNTDDEFWHMTFIAQTSAHCWYRYMFCLRLMYLIFWGTRNKISEVKKTFLVLLKKNYQTWTRPISISVMNRSLSYQLSKILFKNTVTKWTRTCNNWLIKVHFFSLLKLSTLCIMVRCGYRARANHSVHLRRLPAAQDKSQIIRFLGPLCSYFIAW